MTDRKGPWLQFPTSVLKRYRLAVVKELVSVVSKCLSNLETAWWTDGFRRQRLKSGDQTFQYKDILGVVEVMFPKMLVSRVDHLAANFQKNIFLIFHGWDIGVNARGVKLVATRILNPSELR